MSLKSSSSSPVVTARHILNRIGAAILGGYVFVWGFIALSLAGLYALGMPFHDAESLGSIIGFLLYLSIFLWAFAAQKLAKVWLILLGGGAAMAATAQFIQHLLI
jgi:hypothetical protein